MKTFWRNSISNWLTVVNWHIIVFQHILSGTAVNGLKASRENLRRDNQRSYFNFNSSPTPYTLILEGNLLKYIENFDLENTDAMVLISFVYGDGT